MIKQKKLIEEGKWDVLIILDACRYDYFEENYENFLKGNLTKKISPASITGDWLNRTFRGSYEDVFYISANPHVNSRIETTGFDSCEHFKEVVDVWDWGWDKEKGTVHPRTMNEAFLQKFKKNEKLDFIIHYQQPHGPYLNLSDKQGDNTTGKGSLFGDIAQTFLNILGRDRISKIRKTLNIRPLGVRNLNRSFAWNVRYLLYRNNPMKRKEKAIPGLKKIISDEQLRELYSENLRIVLNFVENLVENVEGDIVVTADHGEMLGERNKYGHYGGSEERELREVPWFKVIS